MGRKIESKIGEENYNNEGKKMIITDYQKATKILIKFVESGNIVCSTYQNFKNGSIKDYMNCKYYIGKGKYKSKINGVKTIQYIYWNAMLKRCYYKKDQEKHPTYKSCEVCDEWLNFQNFAKWFDENYYEIENQKIHIDKDILVKGNKIYSPDTCVFVPQRINSLFIKSDSTRGKYPIGVTFNKGKYRAIVRKMENNKSKNINLGRYNNEREAFNIYKIEKEKYIKEVAEEYRQYIPNKLYEAMCLYKVDTND